MTRSGVRSRLAGAGRAWTAAVAGVFAVCWVLAWPAPAGAAGGGWLLPVGGQPVVVRGFQPPPEPWLAGHRGVDLRGSPGDPVLSAGAGRVSFAGSVGGKPVVVVTHAGGLRTTYEPVVAAVGRGDEVVAGEVIGGLSAAGSHCLPAACLHWGLRRGDTYLDPLALVGADRQVRLLPVWGSSGAMSSALSSPGSSAWSLAPRVGAVNRARAAGFLEQ
jgi:murein DD-endopeptidase MepM/ murein hydrolase activator NlpD